MIYDWSFKVFAQDDHGALQNSNLQFVQLLRDFEKKYINSLHVQKLSNVQQKREE